MENKNPLRAILLFLLIIVICSTLFDKTPFVLADDLVDELLIKSGMSEKELKGLTSNLKGYISETLDENAKFYTLTTRDYVIDANTFKETRKRGEDIPASDLTVTVTAYSTTYKGEPCYVVYSSFVWNKLVKIKNDVFSIATYPDWEVIPGADKNLRLWMKNINGEKVQYCDVKQQWATCVGYTFSVPSNVGTVKGLYEGNAYMYVKNRISDNPKQLALQYVYVTSSIFERPYSLRLDTAVLPLN